MRGKMREGRLEREHAAAKQLRVHEHVTKWNANVRFTMTKGQLGNVNRIVATGLFLLMEIRLSFSFSEL